MIKLNLKLNKMMRSRQSKKSEKTNSKKQEKPPDVILGGIDSGYAYQEQLRLKNVKSKLLREIENIDNTIIFFLTKDFNLEQALSLQYHKNIYKKHIEGLKRAIDIKASSKNDFEDKLRNEILSEYNHIDALSKFNDSDFIKRYIAEKEAYILGMKYTSKELPLIGRI